jgi:hypothetical protein
MKKVAFAFMACTALANFCSCKKTIAPASLFPLRDQQTLLVDEYLLSNFSGILFDFPLLFKKKYDASGKLNEIDLSFEDDLAPSYALEHDCSVIQAGLKVYLLKKTNPADTLMTIALNVAGRVTSCHVAHELNDITGSTQMEYFYYKDNRIWYIKTVPDANPDYSTMPSWDTVHYDSHGNPAVFVYNAYQYDYSRKIGYQYYIDDQMESTPGYYVCQYLGYFPEVTSPPNLRIHVQADEYNLSLVNYQFDPAGRMIGYGYYFYTGVTIAWHLHL